MGISERAEEKAKNLPYGDQGRLEIARALATEPKLLCLDEPADPRLTRDVDKLCDFSVMTEVHASLKKS